MVIPPPACGSREHGKSFIGTRAIHYLLLVEIYWPRERADMADPKDEP